MLDTVTAAAAVDEVCIVVVVPAAAFVVCGVMVVTELRERESRWELALRCCRLRVGEMVHSGAEGAKGWTFWIP